MKSEVRALNQGNQKRTWNDHGHPVRAQLKINPCYFDKDPMGSSEPYGKCCRTNHTSIECHVGTNKCMWCGSTDHLIPTCPRTLNPEKKGVANSLVTPRQAPPLLKLTVIGRAYVRSNKEAFNSGTIVSRTLFLDSNTFCVLFDLTATDSFIST